MEAYGDGYMAPEEEWEREGLLDPAWEKQQKKVSECFIGSRQRSLLSFPFLSFFSLSFFISPLMSKLAKAHVSRVRPLQADDSTFKGRERERNESLKTEFLISVCSSVRKNKNVISFVWEEKLHRAIGNEASPLIAFDIITQFL